MSVKPVVPSVLAKEIFDETYCYVDTYGLVFAPYSI